MNHPSRDSSLQVWIDWLLSLHAEEIDLGLERVSKVAKQLGIDRPAPFVISVAGTNGKGSSVAMLSSILDVAGYSVGSYTSPHILQFNERIQINGQMVEDQQIIDAFLEIEQARQQTKLTYFEFSTLASLLIFKQSKVEVAVLEVGLGGRLDAVNLVDADAALITAIDVDHIDWLGGDRSVIATEKAGITRTNKPAVCSDPNPPQSLFDYVKEHQVPLSNLKRDFDFKQTQQAWSVELNQAWPELESTSLPFPALQGAFQLQNAAGVLALLAEIKSVLPVTVEAVKKGLISVKHPGRLQKFTANEQAWLIDVAHNPQSAEALAAFLSEADSGQKYNAVFSVLNDKDSLPMVKILAPWIDQWYVSDLQIPRSTSNEGLSQLLMDAGVDENKFTVCDSIEQAIHAAIQQQDAPVLVWGSFFTVSQAFQTLQSRDWV